MMMIRCVLLWMLIALSVVMSLSTLRAADAHDGVGRVLDELHDAASKADGHRYFALFAPDAVFLGTDASERWPIDEFKVYAQARFDTGTGWTYTLKAGRRFITIDQGGGVAWFDELLENAKYGTCRGSGVLRKFDGQWKIAQYNLSIPIPNDLAAEVVKTIRQKSAG
jgi:hypothetical protein